MVTATGKLMKHSAIGGETPGWAIHLDSDLEYEGKKLKLIEVDPGERDIQGLVDKKVRAEGEIATWHGVQRGDYPVLVIETIEELAQ